MRTSGHRGKTHITATEQLVYAAGAVAGVATGLARALKQGLGLYAVDMMNIKKEEVRVCLIWRWCHRRLTDSTMGCHAVLRPQASVGLLQDPSGIKVKGYEKSAAISIATCGTLSQSAPGGSGPGRLRGT